jgi:serine/threonine-protein kinase
MTVVAAVTVYLAGWDRQATSVTRAHLQIVLPDGLRLAVDSAHPTLALSPDGSRLVFVAEDGGTRRLYMRELAGNEARPIVGTEEAASPFFSPDGTWIGFFASTNLMKVSSSSGAPVAVHTTTPVSVNRGATWTAGETVVFASSANSGLALGSTGGEKQRSIADWTDVTDNQAPFSWPDALPGGRRVVFTDNTDQRLDAARLALLSLETRDVTLLGVGGTNPRYSPTGHILYGRSGSLYAVPFDVQRGKTTGAEFRVLDGVISDGNGSVQFAIGGKGALAYVSGSRVADGYELVWIDREGRSESLLDSERPLFGPRLSPDGSQLAVTIVDGSNLDVWLFDFTRRKLTRRLTTHQGEDFGPVWHPDGHQLALGSEVGEDHENLGPGMAWIRELGSPPEPLTRTPGLYNLEFPSSWSRDGQWLAFVATRGRPSGDILIFSPSDPGEPTAFLQTLADERAPMFSPDGRWMAYVSDDTGQSEIYVTPFPGPGDRTLISSRGGTEPLWSRDGRELFYREGDRFMVTRVDGTGERFVADVPEVLFEVRLDRWSGFGAGTANIDVSLDGTRFVMARRKDPVTATVIDVVLNWPQTLPGSAEGTR